MEFETLHKRIPGQKLKVAAYGRISTDKESSEPSLQEQISFNVEAIIENPNWEFAGMFYDDGISGTSIEKRPGFNKMIEYARAGLIDIILVKSISRFARNVVELLTIKRELASKGIEIYFEQQKISSLNPSCDFALILYAQIAESEALSVSKNVKWRVDKNIREGRYYLPVNQMLGYRYDDEGNVVIYEDEAKWIREIFKRYASGEGNTSIAAWLNSNGVKTKNGSEWNDGKIRNVLRNEKYVGDVLFQKTYIENPLNHKSIFNHGQRDQYLIKNAHPKIIDRRTWEQVQKKITQNAKKYNVKSYELDNINGPASRIPYTGFIKCPYCGSFYQHKINHYNGKPTRFMICASNRDRKKCPSEAYKVAELNKILAKIIIALKSDIPSLKKCLFASFKLNDEDRLKQQINDLTEEINVLSRKYRANNSSNNKFIKNTAPGFFKRAVKLAMAKNELVLKLSSELNPESKIKKQIEILEELPEDEMLVEDSRFKEFFSNCVIVNQELIYFVIGKPLGYVPQDPKLIYEGEHEYIIRKTTFKTKYGVYINK